jgi:hypothetical protein
MLLVAMSASAFGCGASSKALARAELVAKADAICGRLHRIHTSMPIKSRQDIGIILPRVASYEQAAIAELEKLTPLESMAADWKQILAADRRLASYTRMYAQSIVSDNIRSARALLSSAVNVQKTMAAMARRDGFKECAGFAS